MLTLEKIYDELQEEDFFAELFSEDTYNGRAALVYETHDLLLCLTISRGEEVQLHLYLYETDDEYSYLIISSEDDLAEVLPTVTSLLDWWLPEHRECLQESTYKTLSSVITELVNASLTVDDFTPEPL